LLYLASTEYELLLSHQEMGMKNNRSIFFLVATTIISLNSFAEFIPASADDLTKFQDSQFAFKFNSDTELKKTSPQDPDATVKWSSTARGMRGFAYCEVSRKTSAQAATIVGVSTDQKVQASTWEISQQPDVEHTTKRWPDIAHSAQMITGKARRISLAASGSNATIELICYRVGVRQPELNRMIPLDLSTIIHAFGDRLSLIRSAPIEVLGEDTQPARAKAPAAARSAS
jgi:hypothetical protein